MTSQRWFRRRNGDWAAFCVKSEDLFLENSAFEEKILNIFLQKAI